MRIEELKKLGVNTEEGVNRCAGNEAFYLKMGAKALECDRYKTLEECIRSGNPDAAFDAAHALKGVLANLSMTPVFEPVNEITELLRTKQNADYSDLLSAMWDQRNALAELFMEDRKDK